MRKLMIGGALVAALSAVAVVPASAYSEYPETFLQYSECAYVRDQIIDSQTGAECVWVDAPEWRYHLYIYG
ncbi:hypothetical protein ACIA49_14070 [Kribbella sp. NPDC051587]|uniref:hypothetical protein n=1 Tax=Kribbella sp. NPDC051587 TaxID=3364119 RepID=UPI0037AF7C1A